MDRPLWQILLSLFFVGLAIQRGATGAVLQLSDQGPAVLAAYAVQVVLALATALGLWLGRTWTIPALLALAGALAVSALIESFWLGVRPPVAAISQIAIVVLSACGLAYLLRHEFEGDPDARDRGLQ